MRTVKVVGMVVAGYCSVITILAFQDYRKRRAMRIDTSKFPPMPTNVRVTFADGTVIPVDLKYDGLNDDGIHVWSNAYPLTEEHGAARCVEADSLPGMTAISLAAPGTE